MADDTVTLYHPPTGATHTFAKRREQLKRRDGWTDPPDDSPPDHDPEQAEAPERTAGGFFVPDERDNDEENDS